MEISSTIPSTAAGSFKSFLLSRNPAVHQIAASGSLPIDSISTPTIVRANLCRTAPRALVRRHRRTKRRPLTGDSGEGAFSGDGDGDDGPFGGGSGGGRSGGGGGGFGGDGASPDWEEERSGASQSDPAFDFVYEVLSFVVLSNCVHFACKKIGRFLADREKVVSMRLVQSIC